MKYYEGFSNWLDKHLVNDMPTAITAINFNLYEGSERTYDIQMIGSDEFDESDGEWACNAIFSTEDDLYFIPRTEDIEDWEQGLVIMTALVQKYLQFGKYAKKLKGYKAVGIGFVDGDIDVLYYSK